MVSPRELSQRLAKVNCGAIKLAFFWIPIIHVYPRRFKIAQTSMWFSLSGRDQPVLNLRCVFAYLSEAKTLPAYEKLGNLLSESLAACK
jgi:hypothetical protein